MKILVTGTAGFIGFHLGGHGLRNFRNEMFVISMKQLLWLLFCLLLADNCLLLADNNSRWTH